MPGLLFLEGHKFGTIGKVGLRTLIFLLANEFIKNLAKVVLPDPSSPLKPIKVGFDTNLKFYS